METATVGLVERTGFQRLSEPLFDDLGTDALPARAETPFQDPFPSLGEIFGAFALCLAGTVLVVSVTVCGFWKIGEFLFAR